MKSSIIRRFKKPNISFDISFDLNNVPEAQDSYKVRKNNGRNGLRKRPMAGVTLRDLDPGATVYGFSISLNTINAACNAKTHSRKQWNSPRYHRLQNPPISTEYDVMYDVIYPWPDLTRPLNFQGRCKKDGRKAVPNFSQIGRRDLALFSKNLGGGCITPPPARRGLNTSIIGFFSSRSTRSYLSCRASSIRGRTMEVSFPLI